MCAQHYVEAPFVSTVKYPEGFHAVGVPLDEGPTPSYPLYVNQYCDSYNYGHVRAHLVADTDTGVLTATAGYYRLIVGGCCVCNARRESLVAYANHSGYIIYSVTSNGLRGIYIGGQYNSYHIEALTWHISYDYSKSKYQYSEVKRLYLGSPSRCDYWWFQPGTSGGYRPMYTAWCASFDSIWANIQADGEAISSYRYPYSVYNGKVVTITSVSECIVDKAKYSFKPQGAEWDWLEYALSFGQPDGRRVRRYLADSYVAAASELPSASANTLQNMLELGSLIAKLVHGDFSSLADFKSLRNLWLAYRYSYTTTKLDISDYRNVTNRLLALEDVPLITTHSQSVFDNYRVRTSITVRGDAVIPHSTATFLDAFNAKLSLVNTWDAIPWSFVVDWFFHVGDVLERLEKCASAYNLNPVTCWSSIERLGGKFYLRFPYTYAGGASVFQDFSCSNKTFIMRIADAICLFSR